MRHTQFLSSNLVRFSHIFFHCLCMPRGYLILKFLSHMLFQSSVLCRQSKVWDKSEYHFKRSWVKMMRKCRFFLIISQKIPKALVWRHFYVNSALWCLENNWNHEIVPQLYNHIRSCHTFYFWNTSILGIDSRAATNSCTMVNHAKSNALKSQIDRQWTTCLKQLPFTRLKRPSPLEENQLHSDRSDSSWAYTKLGNFSVMWHCLIDWFWPDSSSRHWLCPGQVQHHFSAILNTYEFFSNIHLSAYLDSLFSWNKWNARGNFIWLSQRAVNDCNKKYMFSVPSVFPYLTLTKFQMWSMNLLIFNTISKGLIIV